MKEDLNYIKNNLDKLDIDDMLMIIRTNPIISGKNKKVNNQLKEDIKHITRLVLELTEKENEILYKKLKKAGMDDRIIELLKSL